MEDKVSDNITIVGNIDEFEPWTPGNDPGVLLRTKSTSNTVKGNSKDRCKLSPEVADDLEKLESIHRRLVNLHGNISIDDVKKFIEAMESIESPPHHLRNWLEDAKKLHKELMESEKELFGPEALPSNGTDAATTSWDDFVRKRPAASAHMKSLYPEESTTRRSAKPTSVGDNDLLSSDRVIHTQQSEDVSPHLGNDKSSTSINSVRKTNRSSSVAISRCVTRQSESISRKDIEAEEYEVRINMILNFSAQTQTALNDKHASQIKILKKNERNALNKNRDNVTSNSQDVTMLENVVRKSITTIEGEMFAYLLKQFNDIRILARASSGKANYASICTDEEHQRNIIIQDCDSANLDILRQSIAEIRTLCLSVNVGEPKNIHKSSTNTSEFIADLTNKLIQQPEKNHPPSTVSGQSESAFSVTQYPSIEVYTIPSVDSPEPSESNIRSISKLSSSGYTKQKSGDDRSESVDLKIGCVGPTKDTSVGSSGKDPLKKKVEPRSKMTSSFSTASSTIKTKIKVADGDACGPVGSRTTTSTSRTSGLDQSDKGKRNGKDRAPSEFLREADCSDGENSVKDSGSPAVPASSSISQNGAQNKKVVMKSPNHSTAAEIPLKESPGRRKLADICQFDPVWGWMYKCTGVMMSWQNRFFVLTRKGKLMFSCQDPAVEEKVKWYLVLHAEDITRVEVDLLQDSQVRPPVGKYHSNSFYIDTVNDHSASSIHSRRKRYKFCCHSMAELNMWMTALRNATDVAYNLEESGQVPRSQIRERFREMYTMVSPLRTTLVGLGLEAKSDVVVTPSYRRRVQMEDDIAALESHKRETDQKEQMKMTRQVIRPTSALSFKRKGHEFRNLLNDHQIEVNSR